MDVLETGSPRTRIDYDRETLRLTPARQRGLYFVAGFLLVWLTLWSFGGSMAISTILASVKRHQFGIGFFFMLFWSCGWLVGEIAVFSILLLLIFGREVVELTPEVLRLRFSIGRFGRAREFGIDSIQRLRVEESVSAKGARAGFHVAFDYEGKTQRFASSQTEDEAYFIREQLIQRDGRLAKQ